MPTFTDTLLTILAVEGGEKLAVSLAEGAEGLSAYAAAEGTAAAAGLALEGVIDTLLAPLALLTAGFAVLLAGVETLTKSLEEFSKGEAVTARLALQMRNLGNVFPTPELLEFSERLQDLTGISHNVIAGLGGTAAQFGLNRQQIEKLLPTVLDIAQAKGLDPDQVLNRLLRASRGRPQGLVALGIDPSKITGDLKNVDNLIDQVGKGFKGVSEGFRDTLPGTTAALGASMERLFEALGRFISPVVVPLLNVLIDTLDEFSAILKGIADLFPGLFPTAANLGAGKGGAGDIAFKGDPEQTGYLKEISKHTQKIEDQFIQGVLGGPGVVARSAFTARDMRVAFSV